MLHYLRPLEFTPSIVYNHLTMVVVCHDLVKLYYPLIESFWSAIPLGCRFLVGIFDCTDNSLDYYRELSKYAPIEIINGPWHPDLPFGQGIGAATQHLFNHSQTEYVYNLQACEILDDNFAQTVFDLYTEPKIVANGIAKPANQLADGMANFRAHFWGTPYFNGLLTQKYTYAHAQRLMHRTAKIDQGDGAWPVGNSGFPLGWVYRYSYCFRNQAYRKVNNRTQLYQISDGETRNDHEYFSKCRRHQPNYHGPHPSYAAHLLDQIDYDINHGLAIFKEHVQPLQS